MAEGAAKVPVVSFVGWANSGKTTLLEKVIPLLRAEGLRVGVVKHDVHGAHVDQPGKDTWRFSAAGASACAIAAPNGAAIMWNEPLDARELVAQMAESGRLDVVLTEGFKREAWPKVLVVRGERNEPQPAAPIQDCIAVATDCPNCVPSTATCPVFSLDDAEGLAGFLLTWLRA